MSGAPVIEREFVTRQHVIRRAMLRVLYVLEFRDDLRLSGFEQDLIHTLGHAPEECTLALKYLLGMQWVTRRGSECRITAQGMDFFEKEFQ